jgi:hypothetical protein
MDEIEKRMVLKAGNTPVWKKEVAPPTSTAHVPVNKPEAMPEKMPEKMPERRNDGKFGTGLSADDVDRIAANFLRDISGG